RGFNSACMDYSPVPEVAIGALESGAKGCHGLPGKSGAKRRVFGRLVGVARRRGLVVETLELDGGDFLEHVHELVDCRGLRATEVHRAGDAGAGKLVDALDAVVDVEEAAGLRAVAPDGNLVDAAELGRNDLFAQRLDDVL